MWQSRVARTRCGFVLQQYQPGMRRIILAVITGILTLSSPATSDTAKKATPQGPQDFCQADYFQPRCEKDEVIVMQSAKYGRMRVNRCVRENFGYIGCGRDVLEHLDMLCSGRRICNVRVLDDAFESIQPCHEDLKSFLTVSYKCISVAKALRSSCRAHQSATLTDARGYIGSVVAEETGCGSAGKQADAPWIIKVLPGQRISVTLLDFALRVNGSKPHSSDQTKVCRVYATIREAPSTRSVTVCGGKSRQRHVYTSATNQLEMRLLNSKTPNNPVYFMFKYEAIGCPKLPEPANGWVQQDQTTAIIGCHEKQKSWRLHCNGTKWVGEYGNCSESVADSVTGNQEDNAVVSMSFEISVMVVIVLAITIGLMVLALGLYCMKKQTLRPRRGNQTTNYDDSSDENIRDIHLIKPIPQEQVGFQPNAIVMTQKDPTLKENEYASMRLLSNFPDVMYDRENIVNQSRDPRCPAHMFDSPQAEHKHAVHTFETFSPPDSGIHSDYAPQYFDLDPESTYKCHNKDCVIASTLPGRANKPKCHLAGLRGSRGSGGEIKFTVVDYGTGRKTNTRASCPADIVDSTVTINTSGKCPT